jgi:hypothetical protein
MGLNQVGKLLTRCREILREHRELLKGVRPLAKLTSKLKRSLH